MDIAAAFVANHAEIEGDKLYVAGGAWAWLRVTALPQSMVIQLALILVAEQDEGIDSVLVRVFVSDATPMPSYGTELLVPWPKRESLQPSQPVVVPVVLNVPYTVKRAGRHRLDVVFDYDGSARCSVPFAVIGP
jgi:hypothetical protein